MRKGIPNEVDECFELLIEEIEQVANTYVVENTKAQQAGDFLSARKLFDRAELITTFRQKVDSIRREWDQLEPPPSRTHGHPGTKLPKGVRTREDEYYEPILRSLMELGGLGKTSKVLDRVGEKMHDILKPVDHEPLATQPNEPRWRNTAKWARNTLVQDGRMRADSPQGTWEITQAGRQFVAALST